LDKYIWNKQLETGIAPIDIQHQAILKECNKILEEVEQGIDESVIKKHIAFFLSYSMNHFMDEEEYMRSHGYPDLENHQKKHLEIKERLKYFMENSLEANTDKFTYFLTHEWVRHILDADFLYVRFIRVHGK
jgi:hemerythrin-like metal-binding protein